MHKAVGIRFDQRQVVPAGDLPALIANVRRTLVTPSLRLTNSAMTDC
jgi:hypothetical protein